MIIDHESKFIFVAVAKTACTSIHRSFEITQDPEPNIYHMHLKDIIKTNPEAKGYFKFGFVRNPYDRLVSAYHDFKHCEGHQSWAHPIQKYKTFKEFAIDLNSEPCKNWIHLRPQFEYLEIDGKLVTVTSIGDVEHDQKNDGSNAKHAESDSFKRCAMKLGLGLHLWAGEEYYLDKQLDKKEIGKKTKLQSA